MPPLTRRLALQHSDGPAVAPDHPLQLVHVTALNKVIQHLQHTARTAVARTLGEHLIPAAYAVHRHQ